MLPYWCERDYDSFVYILELTYWGQVIYVSISIVSNNGLSPVWRQAISWANDGLLSVEPLGMNSREIDLNQSRNIIPFNKLHLNISSAKWQPFCIGLTDTAKLTGPRTFADKKWVGPVKLLCIIMFKIRLKSLLGPVKAQKYLRCLVSVCLSHFCVIPGNTSMA